jgi:hypothetical protein
LFFVSVSKSASRREECMPTPQPLFDETSLGLAVTAPGGSSWPFISVNSMPTWQHLAGNVVLATAKLETAEPAEALAMICRLGLCGYLLTRRHRLTDAVAAVVYTAKCYRDLLATALGLHEASTAAEVNAARSAYVRAAGQAWRAIARELGRWGDNRALADS